MPAAKRWIAAPDNHGDQIDPDAGRVFWDFLKFWKPELRIHLGDCFDFRCLRKNATPQEGRERIQADVDAGKDFLERFKPTHWLRGNHDERLVDAAKSDDGKLADYAAHLWIEIKEAAGDAIIYPYDKRKGVMSLGDYRFIHGYHTGLYAARNAALTFGNVIMGHVHAADHASVQGLEVRHGYTSGALCALDQPYNRSHANTLRQSHGFPYGLQTSRGKLIVYQAAAIDGTWYFPSEFKEIKA